MKQIEPLFLAERLAAGDLDPEALAWLAHGLRRFLAGASGRMLFSFSILYGATNNETLPALPPSYPPAWRRLSRHA